MQNKVYFDHDLILRLQSVTQKAQFFQIIAKGCQLRQLSHQRIIHKQSVKQLLLNLYSWLTKKQYFVQQKQIVLNTALSLLLFIGQINTNKEKFKIQVRNQLQYLSKRINIIQKNNNNQSQTVTVLSSYQVQELIDFFQENVCSFYQLYEKVLDHSTSFTVNSKIKQQQKKIEQPELKSGKLLDINSLLNLQVLKKYLSQKPPQQEKKQVKKK